MTPQLHGRSIIGISRAGDGETTVRAINPATGESLEPPFHVATTRATDDAVELAEAAFAEYGSLPGERRGAFLRAIAAEIEASLPEIVARGLLETGLPEMRLRGETARTTGQLRMFAALVEEGSWVDARIEHAQADRQPAPKPDLRSMRRPLGPVVVFCASNFPLAFSVAGGDTASALAAGCPVVAIAHHSHPGVAELVGDAIQRAAVATGMPDGVFSLLFGGGRKVGMPVVLHPAISAVGFTGSRAGGLALVEAAAGRPRPIPVYAEMSSINPLVILPGALARGEEALAAGYFQSLTLGVGQFCTNPGLVLLPESGGEAFVAELAKLIDAHPTATMLNEGIHRAYEEAVEAVAECAGVRTVGRAKPGVGRCQATAAVFETSIRRFLEADLLQGEMFGPAALVVRGSIDEITATIREMEGQLTASLHATEEELAAHSDLAAALERKAGRLIYNSFPTGVEVCHSMVHGGPYPSTSDPRSTSVGSMAIERFVRPVAYQGWPQAALPAELRDENPLGIWRMVDGERSR